MKILIATDNFLPRIDGISRFLDMLIPYFSGHSVTVIAPGENRSEKTIKTQYQENYTVIRVPLTPLKIGDYKIANFPKDITYLVEDADIVFTHTIGPIGTAVIHKAHQLNKKIIAFVHSVEWILMKKSTSRFNPFKEIMGWLTKKHAQRIYKKCTCLIVPSADIGQIFSVQGIKKPKYVVPLGIELDKFKSTSKKAAREYINKIHDTNLTKDDFVVGYVGRLAHEKDLHTLMQALKFIDGENLIVVGDGLHSIKHDFLVLQRDGLLLTGNVDNVEMYLNAMDAFIMPSLTETTCLATLEAMACEVPVIVTKVGSMRDYITHLKNGLFFPKRNATILANRINYIRSHPIKAKELAKKGRTTVVEGYTFKKTAKRILHIFEEIHKDNES